MSIEQMAEVWRRDVDGTKQAVLLVLADHANDDGLAWPRVILIAWKVGKNRRYVQRILRELEELGAIEPFEPGGGRWSSTVYRLTLDRLPEKAPLPDQEKGGLQAAVSRAKGRPTGAETAAPSVPNSGLQAAQNHKEPTEPPRESSSSKRATSIPDGFPDKGALAWAMQNARGLDVRREAAKFRDWAIGNGVTKKDWPATWRNWIRRAEERAGSSSPPSAQSPYDRSTKPMVCEHGWSLRARCEDCGRLTAEDCRRAVEAWTVEQAGEAS